jgi:hypothetical protein
LDRRVNRYLRVVLKSFVIVVGGFGLFVGTILALWEFRQYRYEPLRREAMRFCDDLIPLIEAARTQTGEYPRKADPKWIEGKKLPQLVKASHFYKSDGKTYLLYFRNPGDFWNDFWAKQCGLEQGCVWDNYDANRETD